MDTKLLVLMAASCCVALPAGPTVTTALGDVQGVEAEDGIDIFWGIPFALPPVGERRLAPPQPAKPWSGVLKANKVPTECPQLHIFKEEWGGAEDCLYLSVYRPSGTSTTDKLPVMVWIYGGAFEMGDEYKKGSYDGRYLAKNHGVIVVAVNYRLNSLGFLALPSLMAQHNTTGNYGLLDQQMALKWVQGNIEFFGGDKDRVLIFGQSAGGCSVVSQVSMPSSRGLFHAAVMESSLPVGNIPWMSLKNATAFGEVFARELGCGDAATQVQCLRDLPLEKILNKVIMWRRKFPDAAPGVLPRLMPVMNWWPVVDGTVLPDYPVNMAAKGELADVPFIMGTNHAEGSLFVPLVTLIVNSKIPVVPPFTSEGLRRAVRHFFNETVTESVMALYNTHPNRTMGPTDALALIVRDYFFVCPARKLLRTVTSHPKRQSKVYMYHFDYPMAGEAYKELGNHHSAEVPYVFDHRSLEHYEPLGTWNATDKRLASQLGAYWSAMAATGKGPLPHDETCITWPAFDGPSPEPFMRFSSPLAILTDYFAGVCDFWDKWGYDNSP